MSYSIIELDGVWRVAAYQFDEKEANNFPNLEKLDWIEAQVPGAVHYDLIEAGRLENPFASSKAALESEWVPATDWIYHLEFSLDESYKQKARVALQFDGIDTYSDIWLNGQLIGHTENAFRSYSFEIDPVKLRLENNQLIVHVKSHYRMIEPKIADAERMGRSGDPSGLLGKSLIRRYQRNFNSNSSLLNLGTAVIGIGLYRPVKFIMSSEVYIEHSHFYVDELNDTAAARVIVELGGYENSNQSLRVETKLVDKQTSQIVASEQVAVNQASIEIPLFVKKPKLWWPAGYGLPNLYHLCVEIYDGALLIHSEQKQVGIRKVDLITRAKNGRKTFAIAVNGQKIHARGSNLIPVDYIKAYENWDVYERLFSIMTNGNTNMIRIWGGGVLESDRFYRTCDELGIMIWHDFFLHSNVYPDYDPEFVEQFKQESIEIMRKIRDHACVVLLCGGNEQQEGWDEWNWKAEIDQFYGEKLVKELLPPLVAQYCSDIPYINNSPHGGLWAQSPVEGDMHCWGNYYNATKDPQFVTETCWNLESYSRPETLLQSMGLDVEQFNQRGWNKKWTEVTGLPLMTRFPHSNYFSVETLREYLHSLEIEQARADYNALSVLRLRSSSCSGILYWSFNKGGPLFGFGCVDYKGYPLMSYYVLKRLYANQLIGIYRDMDDIRIVASNLAIDKLDAQLKVIHLNSDGDIIDQFEKPVQLEGGQTARIHDLIDYYPYIVDRTREVIHVQLIVKDEVISEDTLYFSPFSEVVVAHTPLKASVESTGNQCWSIHLEVGAVAKMIEIESNKKLLYSDNYFSTIPGKVKTIHVTMLEDTGDEACEVKISSLDAPDQNPLILKLK